MVVTLHAFNAAARPGIRTADGDTEPKHTPRKTQTDKLHTHRHTRIHHTHMHTQTRRAHTYTDTTHTHTHHTRTYTQTHRHTGRQHHKQLARKTARTSTRSRIHRSLATEKTLNRTKLTQRVPDGMVATVRAFNGKKMQL